MKCDKCDNELDIENDLFDFIETDNGEYYDIYHCKVCNSKTTIED